MRQQCRVHDRKRIHWVWASIFAAGIFAAGSTGLRAIAWAADAPAATQSAGGGQNAKGSTPASTTGNSAAQAVPGAADANAQNDPKSAARAFADALGRGDASAAKSLCNGGADDAKFIDAITNMINGVNKFNDALVSKFGDAAKLPENHNPAQQLIDEIDRSDVKIDGNDATLSRPGDANPLTLVKVDGKWKIAALAKPAQLRQGTAMFNATAQAANEIAADVTAGKFPSLDASRQALNTRRRAAFKAMMSAATAPAAPATAPAAPAPDTGM